MIEGDGVDRGHGSGDGVGCRFVGIEVGGSWRGRAWRARSRRTGSWTHDLDVDEVGHELTVEVSGF